MLWRDDNLVRKIGYLDFTYNLFVDSLVESGNCFCLDFSFGIWRFAYNVFVDY